MKPTTNVAIVIPVYKSKLDKFEIISLRQCLKILLKYDIKIVAPRGLDISIYILLSKEYNKQISFEWFSPDFFTSLNAYNKLMLSWSFYHRFKNYSFILIYQLDSFVFRDELKYWCDQGHDYIGAPWFENFGDAKIDSEIIGIGNGGFSLRKIKGFLHVWSHHACYTKRKLLENQYKGDYKNSKFYRKIYLHLYLILRSLGYKNNFDYWISLYKGNEDLFWTQIVPQFCKKFKVAAIDKAIKFSFEKNPEILYKKNENLLPFGCHAWNKYSTPFWTKIMKELV